MSDYFIDFGGKKPKGYRRVKKRTLPSGGEKPRRKRRRRVRKEEPIGFFATPRQQRKKTAKVSKRIWKRII